MTIKYLKHNEINKQKWDKTVSTAKNSLPYAFSWFLDAVSERWEALIVSDYQYIMPLPVKKKFGIKYAVQPLFCQQLGIFSHEIVTQNIVNEFIKAIPYIFFTVHLNYKNFCKAKEFPNLILSLSNNYENIKQNFSGNTKRNILKAKKFGLKIKMIDAEDFFYFWRQENIDKFSQNLSVLEKIINVKNDFIKLYCVVNEINKVIATNLVLETEQRIINLVPTSNAEGKEKSAMFFLLNYLLEKNSGKEIIFDFEGSKIQGVARFYRGFGANYEPYFFIQNKRTKWLKKLIHK
jgi:hypothetical protein